MSPVVADPDVVDLVDALFSAQSARQDSSPSASSDVRLDTDFWAQLESLGLTRLTGDVASGGSGGSWLESAALLAAAARHSVPVPVVEHDLLAGWLREEAGLAPSTRLSTACVLDLDGTADDVPWAGDAEEIVALWESEGRWLVASFDAAECHVTTSRNVAGEPRGTVRIDPASPSAHEVSSSLAGLFFHRGALARAVQSAAVLQEAVRLSVEHVATRTQFGRPLAAFQAVQQLIASSAAESALCSAAVDSAIVHAVRDGWRDPDLAVRIAVARSCAAEATAVVVANAHQVHGAIGTTMEHRLHRLTLPALGWRTEFGTPHHWDEMLTEHAVQAGPDGLWSLILGSAT